MPLNIYMLNELLLGVVVCMAAVIALFFLRFWARSRDPLFLCFSLAFWVLAINWLALALTHRDEPHTILYIVRLAAFGLILAGIWTKNRART